MNMRLSCSIYYFLGILLTSVIFCSHFTHAETVTPKVYIIPVSGDVEPGMAAFIKRSLNSIPDNESPIIILETDTFGGRVDSALEIVETLSQVRRGKTVAYVKTKAISAGALISLASDSIAMREGTTIGDCAPIAYTKEGPEMLGEKMQSPLRAKFRALAKRNGYSEPLAESMVSKDIEVYKVVIDGKTDFIDKTTFDEMDEKTKKLISSKTTVIKKGQLLTMTDAEALDLGFSKMTVVDIKDLIARMGAADYEIVRIQESWSERLVRLLIGITPLLMLIGIAALYTEIKNPGFGLPGIIGIICLGLALGSQYIVGLADYTELLFIVTGFLLLIIEVLVFPGFGIAGIAGIALIIVGLILALQGFTLPDPDMPWETDLFLHNITMVLSSFIAGLCMSLFFLRYLIPGLIPKGRGPYLNTTLKDATSRSSNIAALKAGDQGIALSYLRPSGKGLFDGEPHDVITEGEFIEKDSPIAVTYLKENKIFVSLHKTEK